jgi:hypothetical protein
MKETSGDAVMIKKYPFDGRWRLLLSQEVWAQPHIHELFLHRESKAQSCTVTEMLKSLPPWPQS